MKNKLLTVFICAVLSFAFIFGSISAAAESHTGAVSEAKRLADGIIDFKLAQNEADDVQELIDGALTDNAGLTSEWYIFALSRTGSYDFSAYEAALLEYISENEIRSAATKQKYALILIAAGSSNAFISEVLNGTIGQQGVMSLIYGLHLLNNGYACSTETVESVTEKLLSSRTPDGGWAVMGETADIDVTSMAIQALAPHYSSNDDTKAAVDEALALLSERQLDGGDYSSLGIPNPESTAQVLTALSCLGIDAETDSRFIKNGNTLFDGLKKYRLDNGSFSHEEGKEFAETSTVQALYSLVAYVRMSEGKTPLYIFEKPENSAEAVTPVTEAPQTAAPEELKTEPETVIDTDIEPKNGSYKPFVCLIIAAAAIITAVLLLALKKGKKGNLAVLAVLTAAALLFVIFTDFKAADDYYGEGAEKNNPIGNVTLSIRCDTIIGKSDKDYIPADGKILEDTFEIEAGETVYDILIEAAKKHSIQLDHSGITEMTYITGINYIYEFDFGDLSGWMYYVNGESPSVSCDKYTLSDGDKIEWLYTCELGNDL